MLPWRPASPFDSWPSPVASEDLGANNGWEALGDRWDWGREGEKEEGDDIDLAALEIGQDDDPLPRGEASASSSQGGRIDELQGERRPERRAEEGGDDEGVCGGMEKALERRHTHVRMMSLSGSSLEVSMSEGSVTGDEAEVRREERRNAGSDLLNSRLLCRSPLRDAVWGQWAAP